MRQPERAPSSVERRDAIDVARVLALGAVVAAAGGAVIGLYGPATVPRAIVCCTLLGAGWVMLRTAEPTS